MSTDAHFVILEHDHPSLHWDFMLEADGVLRTWRLPGPPEDGEMAAEQLADHRLAYLDYEGPVSDDRGRVKRYDRGIYQVIATDPDKLHVAVRGTIVIAEVVLKRLAGTEWTSAWRFCN